MPANTLNVLRCAAPCAYRCDINYSFVVIYCRLHNNEICKRASKQGRVSQLMQKCSVRYVCEAAANKRHLTKMEILSLDYFGWPASVHNERHRRHNKKLNNYFYEHFFRPQGNAKSTLVTWVEMCAYPRVARITFMCHFSHVSFAFSCAIAICNMSFLYAQDERHSVRNKISSHITQKKNESRKNSRTAWSVARAAIHSIDDIQSKCGAYTFWHGINVHTAL